MATVNFHVKSNVNLKDILAFPCDEAEKWLADEILKDTRPYTPALTESLSNRARAIGKNVVYPGPYARYLYYGKVMKGPKLGPKYATEKNLVFTRSVHQMAQAKWFEASKAQNLQKWIRGVARIVATRK